MIISPGITLMNALAISWKWGYRRNGSAQMVRGEKDERRVEILREVLAMRPGETLLQAECTKTDRMSLQPMGAELYCPIDGERRKE